MSSLQEWNKQVKKEKDKRFLIQTLIILSIVALPSIILISGQNLSQVIYQATETNETQCTNLSLSGTAYCLNNIVNDHFKYVARLDFQQSDKTLFEDGGDCSDWSNYYVKQARRLGFYSKTVDMETGRTFGHMAALISNKEGWCILDQTNIKCFYFAD